MVEKYRHHGRHWGALHDLETFEEEVLGPGIEHAVLHGAWPCTDIVNGTDRAESLVCMRCGSERVADQFLLVSDAAEKHLSLVSAYPVLLDGIPTRVRVTRLDPWPNTVEGWIECDVLDAVPATFFDTMFFAGNGGLQPGQEVEVVFAALAYVARPLEQTEVRLASGALWEMQRDQALARGESREVAERPVVIDLSRGAFFLPRGEEFPDEAEFQGVVEAIDRLEYHGEVLYRLELVIARPEDDTAWRVPVFAPEKALGEHLPRIGEPLQGAFWLQGRLASVAPGEH